MERFPKFLLSYEHTHSRAGNHTNLQSCWSFLCGRMKSCHCTWFNHVTFQNHGFVGTVPVASIFHMTSHTCAVGNSECWVRNSDIQKGWTHYPHSESNALFVRSHALKIVFLQQETADLTTLWMAQTYMAYGLIWKFRNMEPREKCFKITVQVWGVLNKVQQSSIGIYIYMASKWYQILHLEEAKTKTKKKGYGYELTKCPDSSNWTNNESGASNVFSSRNIRCRVLQGSPTLNDSARIFLKLWQFARLICRKPDAMKITSCTAAKAQALVWTKATKHTTSSQSKKGMKRNAVSITTCSAFPTKSI